MHVNVDGVSINEKKITVSIHTISPQKSISSCKYLAFHYDKMTSIYLETSGFIRHLWTYGNLLLGMNNISNLEINRSAR
jgi:hypothetical protein